MNLQRELKIVFAASFLVCIGLPSFAQTSVLSGSVQTKAIPAQHYVTGHTSTMVRRKNKRVHYVDNRTYFQRHPMQKGAAVGAGVGSATGGITGLITGRGVVRGAAIGAGTGAGVGVVRTSKTMKRHPIVRDTATGGLVGMGLGWAGSRRGSTVGKTTALGAAAGLGVGLYKHLK